MDIIKKYKEKKAVSQAKKLEKLRKKRIEAGGEALRKAKIYEEKKKLKEYKSTINRERREKIQKIGLKLKKAQKKAQKKARPTRKSNNNLSFGSPNLLIGNTSLLGDTTKKTKKKPIKWF